MRRTACLLAALAMLLTACSDDDDNDSAGDGDETTTTTAAAGGPGGDASEVVQRDFAFDPTAVDVPDGGATLRIVNAGKAPHTFTVDSLNIDEEVKPGDEVEVAVTAPSGEVAFYCRFHRGQGMQGTLR